MTTLGYICLAVVVISTRLMAAQWYRSAWATMILSAVLWGVYAWLRADLPLFYLNLFLFFNGFDGYRRIK